MMKIDIRNPRVIDPATGRDESTPLFIADGRIAAGSSDASAMAAPSAAPASTSLG